MNLYTGVYHHVLIVLYSIMCNLCNSYESLIIYFGANMMQLIQYTVWNVKDFRFYSTLFHIHECKRMHCYFIRAYVTLVMHM